MTNSRPPSGRVPAPAVSSHAHNSLLPVPPRLPFPTSPAMPDRRARLKRLNLSSIASRESGITEAGSDGGSVVEEDVLLSKRAARMGHTPRGYHRTHAKGRIGSASNAATVVQNNRNLSGDFSDAGSDRLHPHLNLMDLSSDDPVSDHGSGNMPPRE